MSARVLVVDDDPDIRTVVRTALQLADFTVVEAADGTEALAVAATERPHVIVLDRMMPGMDGIEVLRHLRRDGRLAHLPVILLTARSQAADVLEGFASGADDYVTKPFDPEQLVARVRALLRRLADMRALQPLTGLPGNTAIDLDVARRVEADEPFVFLLADLNNFKAYNDHYGFRRGDEVLVAFATMVTEAVDDLGDRDTFVGHVGGDDFVVVTGLGAWEALAREICLRFDAAVPQLYDADDRGRGAIRVADRQGTTQTYPFVGVSIGAAVFGPGECTHPEELVSVATEMKAFAKGEVAGGGSNVAVDRRLGTPATTT